MRYMRRCQRLKQRRTKRLIRSSDYYALESVCFAVHILLLTIIKYSSIKYNLLPLLFRACKRLGKRRETEWKRKMQLLYLPFRFLFRASKRLGKGREKEWKRNVTSPNRKPLKSESNVSPIITFYVNITLTLKSFFI